MTTILAILVLILGLGGMPAFLIWIAVHSYTRAIVCKICGSTKGRWHYRPDGNPHSRSKSRGGHRPIWHQPNLNK